jgi:hypothetical protein
MKEKAGCASPKPMINMSESSPWDLNMSKSTPVLEGIAVGGAEKELADRP